MLSCVRPDNGGLGAPRVVAVGGGVGLGGPAVPGFSIYLGGLSGFHAGHPFAVSSRKSNVS